MLLESTTYPCTTDEVPLLILERSGLRCQISDYSVEGNGQTNLDGIGEDFLLVFSPEREDSGNRLFKTYWVPKRAHN